MRCECGLIQFKSGSGLCVKSSCRKPYVDPEEIDRIEHKAAVGTGYFAAVIDNPNFPVRKEPLTPVSKVLPYLLRTIRTTQGLSQRRLAVITGVPSPHKG